METTTHTHTARKVLAVIAVLFAVLMGYAALTVPMIAAAGPAVLMLAGLVVAYVAWPKKG